MKRFRVGRRSTSTHVREKGAGPTARNRRLTPALWLLTALAAVALFAFLPTGAFSSPQRALNEAANLDGCQNAAGTGGAATNCNATAGGNDNWVNGDLNAGKALYFEGDSVPYRAVISGLTNPPAVHTITIAYDTQQSGKHALDYLTSYDRTVPFGTTASPAPQADPCAGETCTGTPAASAPSHPGIPTDPFVAAAGVTQVPGVFALYGGTITNIGNYTLASDSQCTHPVSAYSATGATTTCIQISFTATGTDAVLAFGVHIARRADWGLLNSAVTISGSPFHTRIVELDGSGGSQDKQIQSSAVVFPGFIHVIKNTTGGDATFGFTASPSPLANCSITTSGGTGGGPDATNCWFNNITDFKTYTVTENTPPAGWAFDTNGLSCSVASPNGGTQTLNQGTRTATIALNEGEEVTCTYANHHTTTSTTTATVLKNAADDSTVSGALALNSSVYDTSSVTPTVTGGPTPTGTVTYHFYKAVTNNTTCAGTEVGTGQQVSLNANGTVPNSDPTGGLAAGNYAFQAVYVSGDNNYTGSTSACEPFTISNSATTTATVLKNAADNTTVSGALC